MSDLRTAAQQALEALDWYAECAMVSEKAADAASALRAALEQPEPEQEEPVAWCDIEEDGTIHGLRYWSEPGRREHALYTHPPRREWRGLTEEEIEAEMPYCHNEFDLAEFKDFAHAIEAALKERNA